MDDHDRFAFVGGDPSLDLVNTLHYHFAEHGPTELLDAPEAVLDWYEAAGLLALDERGAFTPESEALLQSARGLRVHLNRIYRSLIAKKYDAMVDSAIAGLNAVLDRGHERVALRHDRGTFTRMVRLETPHPPDPALRVAYHAAARLERLEPRRLKECANPACDLIFYDDTRNASRRWCDMTTCGNRLKQARHRAAERTAPPNSRGSRP